MIAFSFFGWPIYWYGIFYAMTFAFGYGFFSLIAQRNTVQAFPHLQRLINNNRDDILSTVMIGVLVGGRLGHVFLYDRSYYQQHLREIIQVWQGGMSFV